MDFVTRQFIVLTKKLRKELRKALSDLHNALQNQTRAIRDHYTKEQQNQNAQTPIQIIAELHTPEDVERAHAASEHRHHRLQQWNTVGTWLAFFAVAIYAVITYFQLRDFDASVGISQIIARQGGFKRQPLRVPPTLPRPLWKPIKVNSAISRDLMYGQPQPLPGKIILSWSKMPTKPIA
jgi:hypothetical protein